MAEKVDQLLGSMASQEALPRSSEAERERRQRVTLAMKHSLQLLDSAPRRSSKRLWLALPLVASIALAIGAAMRLSNPARFEVTAEGLPARSAPPPSMPAEAPTPALVPSATPSSSRALPVVPVPVPVPPKPKPSAGPPPASAPTAPDPAAEVPGLTVQNELFQQAVRASRQGDDALALHHLQSLLDRHPGSVLAADARVRKFRTLARLGRAAEARAAAEDYLAHHPSGFAAAEARALVTRNAP